MKMFRVAVLLVLSSLVASTAIARDKPNIVLVFMDNFGWGEPGFNGGGIIRGAATPRIDKLAAEGLRLTNFNVESQCTPSRAAIMTGRHPMRNGVTHTILERERLTLDAVTLPQVLGRAGYTTGIFGKRHLGDEDAYQPHNRGFDEAFIHGAGGAARGFEYRSGGGI